MSKAMIFLMDGTANDATAVAEAETYSNVYAINQLVAEHKEVGKEISTQVTFYLPGVGTKFTVSEKSIFSKWVLKQTQYVFGDNLDQLVLRAYVNLVANYRPNDEIILIGFSRGAAAARIFSRLIADFGILKSGFLMHLDQMWREFIGISEEENDADYFEAIKKLKTYLATVCESETVFHETPQIKFMGLFDTVTGPYDVDVAENLVMRDKKPASNVTSVVHLLSMHENRAEFPPRRFIRNEHCKLREIWLPGVHADIGGGYRKNFLSRIALLTMAKFLEKIGDVALIPDSVEQLTQSLCNDIRAKNFVINRNVKISGRKFKRSVEQDDHVHPVHFGLLKYHVKWKDKGDPTLYESRIPDGCMQDDDVLNWFDDAFSEAFNSLKGMPLHRS
jgi:uncharacterized protein (DUF2235 family)